MSDPKFKFYKSIANGVVYPAMRRPAGYEDDHPDEWEGMSEASGAKLMKEQVAADEATASALKPVTIDGESKRITPDDDAAPAKSSRKATAIPPPPAPEA